MNAFTQTLNKPLRWTAVLALSCLVNLWRSFRRSGTLSLSLAFGMASALFKRERTGEPSVLDVSLLGSAMWVASSDIIYSQVLDTDFSGIERKATNPIATKYRTQDGRWIMFAMLAADRWWPDFCEHVGRLDLRDDPRFTDAKVRAENSAECVSELQTTFASVPLAEWRERLAPLLGPWEVVQDSLEVGADPQARANGYITDVPHPNGVDVTAVRSPVQVDGAAPDLGVAPDAWQHTEEILLELGHDWDRIIELKTMGAIP